MAETVVGTRTKLELVSQSHGAVRVPLAQSFDYTPRFTERTIFEFDNNEAALVVSTFDGSDVRFDYLDSDSNLVDSMLNDLDPTSSIVTHDPSVLREIQIILNIRNENGKIFQSVIAKGVRIRGVASTEPVREESTITIDGAATNVLRLKGGALEYNRILADTPDVSVYQQAIPPNSHTDKNFPAIAPFEITFDNTAVAFNEAGDFGVLVLKNGEVATAGYTITSTKFTLDSEPASTDVWEAVTTYLAP